MLSEIVSSYVFYHPDSILKFVRSETQKQYTLERADILTQLPIPYKRKFGQIQCWQQQKGAATTTEAETASSPLGNGPVLIVSPFDVPPGEVRTKWMKAFLQHRNDDSLNQLPFLVYIYGSSVVPDVGPNPSLAYRLVSPSELTSYTDDDREWSLSTKGSSAEFRQRFLQAVKAEVQVDSRRKKDDRKGALFAKRGFFEAYSLITLRQQPFEENNYDFQQQPKQANDSATTKNLRTIGQNDDNSSSNNLPPVGTCIQIFENNNQSHLKMTGTIIQKRDDFVLLEKFEGKQSSSSEWIPLADYTYRILQSAATTTTAKDADCCIVDCRQQQQQRQQQKAPPGGKDDNQRNINNNKASGDHETYTTCEGTASTSSSSSSTASTKDDDDEETEDSNDDDDEEELEDQDDEDDGEGHDIRMDEVSKASALVEAEVASVSTTTQRPLEVTEPVVMQKYRNEQHRNTDYASMPPPPRQTPQNHHTGFVVNMISNPSSPRDYSAFVKEQQALKDNAAASGQFRGVVQFAPYQTNQYNPTNTAISANTFTSANKVLNVHKHSPYNRNIGQHGAMPKTSKVKISVGTAQNQRPGQGGVPPGYGPSPASSTSTAAKKPASGLSYYLQNQSVQGPGSPPTPNAATSANTTGMSRKKARASRLTEDGFVLPRVPLKQRRDGTFVAPKGRPPLGMYFHNVLGVYVPKAADADDQLSNTSSSQPPPPKKIKKVKCPNPDGAPAKKKVKTADSATSILVGMKTAGTTTPTTSTPTLTNIHHPLQPVQQQQPQQQMVHNN